MPPSVGRVFHDSVKGVSLGPSPSLQILGAWCQPQNMFATMCDERYRPIPDNSGAPSVGVTLQVTLSPNQPDPSVVGQVTRFPDWSDAFLVVDWGSGDTDQPEMEVDLMNGTSFPLIARSARFSLMYPVKESNVTYQPLLDISISIGVGSLGQQDGARRTIKVGPTVQGVPTTVLPIPRFAVGAVYASNDATASATFTQTVSPAPASQSISIATIQKQESQRVPIFTGARGFSITTPAGVSVGSAVIFYLSPA